MDGKIAPLRQICELAEKYNTLVFLDECHATGFLDKMGRGMRSIMDCGVQWTLLTPHWARHWVGHRGATLRDPGS